LRLGRVEVTRRGCPDACVLISKAELEAMERALQIFAESLEFQQMSSQIAGDRRRLGRAQCRRRAGATSSMRRREPGAR
jgi:PHD/YefM family antitoxin component YafN of YafNO toxin-antitoxin module